VNGINLCNVGLLSSILSKLDHNADRVLSTNNLKCWTSYDWILSEPRPAYKAMPSFTVERKIIVLEIILYLTRPMFNAAELNKYWTTSRLWKSAWDNDKWKLSSCIVTGRYNWPVTRQNPRRYHHHRSTCGLDRINCNLWSNRPKPQQFVPYQWKGRNR